MSDFEQRYDQIERYIKDQLQGDELSAFEEELTTNPALKEEVEVQRLSHKVMEYAYLKEMSDVIKDQSATANKNKKGKWFLGLGVLAILVGLLTVSTINSTDEKAVFDVEEPLVIRNKTTLEIESSRPSSESIILIDSSNGVVSVKEKEVLTEEIILTEDQKINGKVDVAKSILNDSDKDTVQVKKVVEDEIMTQNLTSPPVAIKSKKINQTELKKDCVLPKMNKVKAVDCSLNQEDGRLILDRSVGLLYSIDDNEYSDWQETDNLAVGIYSIHAKDRQDCEFDLGEITIKQNNCLKDKDFVFSMAVDRSFNLSIEEAENTNVTIINRVGETVFNSVLDYENQFEWEGYYTNGNPATVGLHKVVIQVPNKETCIYNVVIAQ